MGESKYISTDSCESDSTKASSDESRDDVTEVQRIKNMKKAEKKIRIFWSDPSASNINKFSFVFYHSCNDHWNYLFR